MTISIPNTYKDALLIKTGQKIDFDTPLTHTHSYEQITISIAKKFGIPPKKIFSYLKKFVGDKVEKGEVLAIKKGLLSSQVLKSEYEGMLKEVNHEDGILIIDRYKETDEKKLAFFKGEIEKISDQTIEIKVKHKEIFDCKTIDMSSEQDDRVTGGKTLIINNPDNVSEEDVDGGIIISDTLSSYYKAKLSALGAKGFVTLKNTPDLQKITKDKYSCCIVDRNHNTIVFYNV